MGDKHSRQRFPEEDTSSSSSASGTAKGPTRYKPLAPKGPTSDTANATQGLQRSRSGAGEAARQLQDLTFVNMTDPQQSKSRESRKFVRRQVMVNFAREKRRQQKPASLGGTQTGSNSSNTISGVQELLNAAMPTAEAAIDWSPERGASDLDSRGSHGVPGPLAPLAQVAEAPTTTATHGPQRRKSGPHPPLARRRPSTVSRTTNLPNVPQWPVASDAHVQGLLNHCHSLLFRACHPQYMISLLANRPSAKNYPFFVDIDSIGDLNQDYGAESVVQSEFYRLAENSSMLAHALLMVSASHLAILDVEDAVTRTRQAIDHKSKALELLNETIKGLPANNYLEILATIAVLASHELMVGHYNEWMVHLMGFGRIVNMKGGLTSLPQDNLVRKLMIWTDQMGALFMNVRPFFPATEVMSLFFRPRNTIPPSLLDEYTQQGFLSPAFRDFASAFSISAQLTEILEDVTTIHNVGTENILKAATLPSLSTLADMRDVLLHRILSLAPIGNESDDESSAEECVRLAALIFVLGRLFLPALPPAYHRIVHMITDRLHTTIEGKVSSQEWAGHGWVLMWIHFVGATVHNGDPSTRRSLIQSAVPLCAHLFSGQQKMSAQLRVGLKGVMGRQDLSEEELIDGFAADLEQACRTKRRKGL